MSCSYSPIVSELGERAWRAAVPSGKTKALIKACAAPMPEIDGTSRSRRRLRTELLQALQRRREQFGSIEEVSR